MHINRISNKSYWSVSVVFEKNHFSPGMWHFWDYECVVKICRPTCSRCLSLLLDFCLDLCLSLKFSRARTLTCAHTRTLRNTHIDKRTHTNINIFVHTQNTSSQTISLSHACERARALSILHHSLYPLPETHVLHHFSLHASHTPCLYIIYMYANI